MSKTAPASVPSKGGKSTLPMTTIKRQPAIAPTSANPLMGRSGDAMWHDVMATTIDLPAIDQHGLVQGGVPTEMLDKVVATYLRLDEAEVLGAVGVCLRTVRMRKSGVLSPEHSRAMLDLIAVTQNAMDVLGTREAAEEWLHKPALAFGGLRPIALLSTRQGADLVKDHLTRLDYGVYA